MLRYKTETRPGLVALYDIRPGNRAGLFLQPRSPHRAFELKISRLQQTDKDYYCAKFQVIPIRGFHFKMLTYISTHSDIVKKWSIYPCRHYFVVSVDNYKEVCLDQYFQMVCLKFIIIYHFINGLLNVLFRTKMF